jgi:hypothetical protein
MPPLPPGENTPGRWTTVIDDVIACQTQPHAEQDKIKIQKEIKRQRYDKIKT